MRLTSELYFLVLVASATILMWIPSMSSTLSSPLANWLVTTQTPAPRLNEV